MKKILLIIVIVLAFLGLVVSIKKDGQTTDPENTDRYKKISSGLHTIKHDGLVREYFLFVPTSYDGTKPFPLIVNFHGGGGGYQSAIDETQMNTQAEKDGFFVVYPSAAKSTDGVERWNNGPRPAEPHKEGIANDEGFIRDLIKELVREHNIDSKRLYVTGISNGAYMTYYAACKMSDIFAAAAPVSGYLLLTNCDPENPMPLLHIHGLQDKLTPFGGGPSTGVPAIFANKDNFRSALESVEFFVNRNGCSADNTEITYDTGGAQCVTHKNCRTGREVALCKIGDGGHTWPGGAYPIDKPWYKNLVGNLSTDINANEFIFDFFKKYSR